MRMNEESKKVGLKLNIQKTKIMASGPISSVQFSRSVMSDSSRPHESQHTRPPCPSPTPGVHSDSHPYMTTRKTIALTRWTFVGKVMSLLFNMLSRFVIAFLPRSKCLLISSLQTSPTVIFGAQEKKMSSLPLFPLLFAMK